VTLIDIERPIEVDTPPGFEMEGGSIYNIYLSSYFGESSTG